MNFSCPLKEGIVSFIEKIKEVLTWNRVALALTIFSLLPAAVYWPSVLHFLQDLNIIIEEPEINSEVRLKPVFYQEGQELPSYGGTEWKNDYREYKLKINSNQHLKEAELKIYFPGCVRGFKKVSGGTKTSISGPNLGDYIYEEKGRIKATDPVHCVKEVRIADLESDEEVVVDFLVDTKLEFPPNLTYSGELIFSNISTKKYLIGYRPSTNYSVDYTWEEYGVTFSESERFAMPQEYLKSALFYKAKILFYDELGFSKSNLEESYSIFKNLTEEYPKNETFWYYRARSEHRIGNIYSLREWNTSEYYYKMALDSLDRANSTSYRSRVGALHELVSREKNMALDSGTIIVSLDHHHFYSGDEDAVFKVSRPWGRIGIFLSNKTIHSEYYYNPINLRGEKVYFSKNYTVNDISERFILAWSYNDSINGYIGKQKIFSAKLS